jgi:peroxiredoxin
LRKIVPLILVVAGIALLIAGLLLLKSGPAETTQGIAIGQVALVSDGSKTLVEKGVPAPDFEIKYPDGSKVLLSDLKGKPVLVNFWATWCKFCEAEMPAIQAAYEKYKAQGFVVIAIDSKESKRTVANFFSDRGLTFTVAIDPTDAVFRRYRGSGWPHSVFVDKQGIVSEIYIGQMSASQIEKFLAAIR